MEHHKNHKSKSSLPARKVMHSGVAYKVGTESTVRELQKQKTSVGFSPCPLPSSF